MKSSVTNVLMALGLIAIGVGIAVVGIYIGETDEWVRIYRYVLKR